MIKGYNALVIVDNMAVAFQKECTLSINRDMVEIAGTSPDAREYKPGRYSGSIIFSGLQTVDEEPGRHNTSWLIDKLIEGTRVSVTYDCYDHELGQHETREAQGYVADIQLAGELNGTATYSCTIQLSGSIEKDIF